MSVETNKETVRRFIEEVVNQHQLQVAQELATQDYLNHDPTGKATPGVTQNMTGYRSAFPDLHYTITQMLGEGDLVAVQWTASGTHQQSIAHLTDGIRAAANRQNRDRDGVLPLPLLRRQDCRNVESLGYSPSAGATQCGIGAYEQDSPIRTCQECAGPHLRSGVFPVGAGGHQFRGSGRDRSGGAGDHRRNAPVGRAMGPGWLELLSAVFPLLSGHHGLVGLGGNQKDPGWAGGRLVAGPARRSGDWQLSPPAPLTHRVRSGRRAVLWHLDQRRFQADHTGTARIRVRTDYAGSSPWPGSALRRCWHSCSSPSAGAPPLPCSE